MTDTDDARMVLSEMIEITEKTIDRTFHRHDDLDALYRQCPTAFWLAPDGGGVLAPPDAPMRPVPVDPPPSAAIDPAVHGLPAGIWRAVIAAGPIFAAAGMMLNRTETDRHWWDPFGRALASLVAFPLTITVGALLALLPVLVGVFVLGQAGTILPTVRRPAAWALTGGLMGIAIAALFDAGGTIGLALVATSVACASIARASVDWLEPDVA